jgi:hypothetical protein
VDNIGSLTRYFLGDFNATFRLLFVHAPSTDVPSFVEKYPTIKYAISDMRQLGLCETSFYY